MNVLVSDIVLRKEARRWLVVLGRDRDRVRRFDMSSEWSTFSREEQ